MQKMYIDPQGVHGLRKAMRGRRAVRAHMRGTEEGIHIEFSDGRSSYLCKDPRVPMESFMAAAMQWARRHGATALEIELS
jgi:hypothetical protein